MNWYYYDSFGKKRGPVNNAQLKYLAHSGHIHRNTMLETDTGRRGRAGQVKGLFSNEDDSQRSSQPKQSTSSGDYSPSPTSTGHSFCTNCGALVSPHALACMKCGANPKAHRKFCSNCGASLNPEQIICVKCGVSVENGGYNNNHYSSRDLARPDDAKVMENLFTGFKKLYTSSFIVLCFSLVLFSIALSEESDFLGGIGMIGFFITGCLSIGSCVYACRLLYRMWCQIPAPQAQTTPGKAVGFLFIPFFNLYWVFVAYSGLANSLNQCLWQKGSNYTVPVGPINFACISIILSMIPYLGVVFTIVNVFMCFRMLKTLKDGAVVLANMRR